MYPNHFAWDGACLNRWSMNCLLSSVACLVANSYEKYFVLETKILNCDERKQIEVAE